MTKAKNGIRLRVPRAGEAAPNFKLPTLDGTTVELTQYSKPVALVFLRHLA